MSPEQRGLAPRAGFEPATRGAVVHGDSLDDSGLKAGEECEGQRVDGARVRTRCGVCGDGLSEHDVFYDEAECDLCRGEFTQYDEPCEHYPDGGTGRAA